jgi:hypothetical protein
MGAHRAPEPASIWVTRVRHLDRDARLGVRGQPLAALAQARHHLVLGAHRSWDGRTRLVTRVHAGLHMEATLECPSRSLPDGVRRLRHDAQDDAWDQSQSRDNSTPRRPGVEVKPHRVSDCAPRRVVPCSDRLQTGAAMSKVLSNELVLKVGSATDVTSNRAMPPHSLRRAAGSTRDLANQWWPQCGSATSTGAGVFSKRAGRGAARPSRRWSSDWHTGTHWAFVEPSRT